jgi:hypothetical protein
MGVSMVEQEAAEEQGATALQVEQEEQEEED